MMRRNMLILALVAALLPAAIAQGKNKLDSPTPNPEAKFKTMEVIFHTTQDDKDHDTRVEIFVVAQNGSPALAYLDIGGGNQPHVPNRGFPNNSTSDTFVVPPFGPGFKFKDMKQLKLLVKMTPAPIGAGDDNWKYWVEAVLHFEDGTKARVQSAEVYPHATQGKPQSNLFDLSAAQVLP